MADVVKSPIRQGTPATAAPIVYPPSLASARAFLGLVCGPAIESQTASQIPACVTAAQAIFEAAAKDAQGVYVWGLSSLFRFAHNPFGIKFSHLAGTEGYTAFDAMTWEIVNGKRDNAMAAFCKFPDLATAFKVHAQLLSSPHYAAAYKVRTDWQAFAHDLGPKQTLTDTDHCGYSTDPDYGVNLVVAIREYHLDDMAVMWQFAGAA